MKEHVPSEPARLRKLERTSEHPRAKPAGGPGAGARHPGVSPDQALALQRLVGNRAATLALSRWTNHPDQTKKGVVVPDVVAAEFLRFNPPKNQ